MLPCAADLREVGTRGAWLRRDRFATPRCVAKKKPSAPPRAVRPRIPALVLFRMFAIGAVSVVAAAYGLWRHYAVPRPSMLVAPGPPPTELPAPDLVPMGDPPADPSAQPSVSADR